MASRRDQKPQEPDLGRMQYSQNINTVHGVQIIDRQSLQCLLCGVQGSSKIDFCSHLRGQRHRNMLFEVQRQENCDQFRIAGEPRMHENGRQGSGGSLEATGTFSCNLCGLDLPTRCHLRSHLNGKRHIKRMAEQLSRSRNVPDTAPMNSGKLALRENVVSHVPANDFAGSMDKNIVTAEGKPNAERRFEQAQSNGPQQNEAAPDNPIGHEESETSQLASGDTEGIGGFSCEYCKVTLPDMDTLSLHVLNKEHLDCFALCDRLTWARKNASKQHEQFLAQRRMASSATAKTATSDGSQTPANTRNLSVEQTQNPPRQSTHQPVVRFMNSEPDSTGLRSTEEPSLFSIWRRFHDAFILSALHPAKTFCVICNLTMSSVESLKDHVQGPFHASMLALRERLDSVALTSNSAGRSDVDQATRMLPDSGTDDSSTKGEISNGAHRKTMTPHKFSANSLPLAQTLTEPGQSSGNKVGEIGGQAAPTRDLMSERPEHAVTPGVVHAERADGGLLCLVCCATCNSKHELAKHLGSESHRSRAQLVASTPSESPCICMACSKPLDNLRACEMHLGTKEHVARLVQERKNCP